MEAEAKSNKFVSTTLFVFCLVYFVGAVYYYLTGYMGTMFWVLVLVPLAYIIYVLENLKNGTLYPRLGKLQYLLVQFM